VGVPPSEGSPSGRLGADTLTPSDRVDGRFTVCRTTRSVDSACVHTLFLQRSSEHARTVPAQTQRHERAPIAKLTACEVPLLRVASAAALVWNSAASEMPKMPATHSETDHRVAAHFADSKRLNSDSYTQVLGHVTFHVYVSVSFANGTV